MSKRIRPVILAGGSGTRLWPLSTEKQPKHLLRLVGQQSLFEQALERVSDRRQFSEPIVVCSGTHADQIHSAAKTPVRVIVEPVARNTAAAIGLAAATVESDELLLVLPSDHHIAEPRALTEAVHRARPIAEDGALVTFGVLPTRIETGYGYITAGEAVADGVFRATRFIEKPDRAAAGRLLASGQNYWNAGIFLMRAKTILAELRLYQKEIWRCATEAMLNARELQGNFHPEPSAFQRCPVLSIDHAVMEHSQRLVLAPVAMGWSDVGNWDSVYEASPKDSDGNVASSGSETRDCRGCIVQSSGPRIFALGVEGLVIVATPTDILVLPRSQAQRVREAAEWARGTAPDDPADAPNS